MSGVIDDKGVQWERCNGCASFVRLTDLGYQPPTREHKLGRDLCIKCVCALSQAQIRKVQPAASWKRVYS